jgi:penicillin-insensitive murein endopeptidase
MRDKTKYLTRIALCCLAFFSLNAHAAESVCYGTPSNGRLEGGVLLPRAGTNFGPYSQAGILLGRTYVHSRVKQTIVDAYAALAQSQPDKFYLYGESGFSTGGQIKPHRTHKNGLAVDFMVPVIDSEKKSVPLPTSANNKYGYSIEFNDKASYRGYTIDFEAIAEHLYALHVAANKNKMGLSRVIFDPVFIPSLYKTRRGKFIRRNIHFMSGKAWIRHDEHYHVDFSLPCRKL